MIYFLKGILWNCSFTNTNQVLDRNEAYSAPRKRFGDNTSRLLQFLTEHRILCLSFPCCKNFMVGSNQVHKNYEFLKQKQRAAEFPLLLQGNRLNQSSLHVSK